MVPDLLDNVLTWASDLLNKANMSTLQLGRIRNIALEVFKILNGLLPSCIHDLVSFRKSDFILTDIKTWWICLERTRSLTVRGHFVLRLPTSGIPNSLSNEIRITTNFKEFGRLVRTWGRASCKSSFCRFNL